jgi:hypothetical protein
MRWLSLVVLLTVVGLVFSSMAHAAPVQFTNGHYYEYVREVGVSWTGAEAAVSSLSFGGLQGHLATISSQAENDFVTSLIPDINDEAAYIGAFRPGPNLDFVWVTGEPMNYMNWSPGEPNGPTTEFYLMIWADSTLSIRPRGGWNDATNSGPEGYIVEYAEPSLGWLGLAVGALLFARRYLAARAAGVWAW